MDIKIDLLKKFFMNLNLINYTHFVIKDAILKL